MDNMEHFQSMQTLIFNFIKLFTLGLLFCFAYGFEITPENPESYNGWNIGEIIITLDRSSPTNFKTYIHELKAGKDFFTTNLYNDLATLIESGQLQDIAVSLEPEQDRNIKIIFNIKLNPIIKYLELSNMSVLNHSLIKEKLSNKTNNQLNYSAISQDISLIETAYHEKGYIFAKVVNITYIKSISSLIYQIDEGVIDQVRFIGLKSIDANILLRRLKLKAGTILNAENLKTDRESIINTGYFSNVSFPRVVPSEESPGKFTLIYDLSERKINNLQIGLEQLQNNKLGAAITIKLPNFRNTGEGLSFKGQTIVADSLSDFSYYLKYTEPWFLSQDLPLNILYWYQINQENINNVFSLYVRRIGWEINIEPQLLKSFTTVLAYKSERANDIDGNYSPYNKNSVRLTLFNNQTNDINNPTKGSKVSFEIEKGNGILNLIQLGGIDFTRYIWDYSSFYEISKNATICYHLGLGSIILNDQNQTIFEQDQFSLGGAYSLRGYPENTFIGNKKILLNFEYRIMLNDWIQGAIFLDGGIAAYTIPDINALEWGRGIGVRLLTPIAPLRFDLAQGSSGEYILHFGLGQIF